jgi:putative transposase
MDTFPARLGAHCITSLFVHFVWATHRRIALLEPSIDAWLGALFMRKARAIDCEILASGVAADHVHVVARHRPRVSVATLVQHLKGASSRAISLQLAYDRVWQVGYWAESVGQRDLPALIPYVRDQRAHHTAGAAPEPWESRVV